MTNRIAVSLAPADTETCLATLSELAADVGMAEIRLDLMESFDLARLIGRAPCPLLLTCRPPREGGRFAGSEDERLAILRRAIELGVAYVDVEWDSVAALADRGRSPTRLVVSRHWYDEMPGRLWATYEALRERADVVKLVGGARRPTDMLPVLDLLRRATGPVIGIAMSAAGQPARLLAPWFPNCLLTYGAVASSTTTAAGQLSVAEMLNAYHLDQVGPHTAISIHLCSNTDSAERASKKNAAVVPGEQLHVPVLVSDAEVGELLGGLRACLPTATISADASLAAFLSTMADAS